MSEQQTKIEMTAPTPAPAQAPLTNQPVAGGTVKRQPSIRQQVQEVFASVEMQAAMALLPPWLDRPSFAAQAAADAADPALSNVPLTELVRGYLTIGRMGMMPGPCKHVARYPRAGALTVQVQWQGLKYVFAQGGWDVTAHVVCTDDTFDYEDIGPDEFTVTKHRYDPLARVVKKENLRGAYGICKSHTTGEIRYLFVEKERIERGFNKAETKNVWNSDYKQMVMKTVYHQIANRNLLPMAVDIQALIQRIGSDEYNEALAFAPAERKPLSIGVATAPLRLVQEVQPEPEQLALTADQCNQGDEVQP